MSKKYVPEKKKGACDWRPFVRLTSERIGPFSTNVYCLALINKEDFRKMKGPAGAIIYGEDGKDYRIGFLKSEFDTLEAELAIA